MCALTRGAWGSRGDRVCWLSGPGVHPRWRRDAGACRHTHGARRDAGVCSTRVALYSRPPMLPGGTISVYSDASHGAWICTAKMGRQDLPFTIPQTISLPTLFGSQWPVTPAPVLDSGCLGASEAQAVVERGNSESQCMGAPGSPGLGPPSPVPPPGPTARPGQ